MEKFTERLGWKVNGFPLLFLYIALLVATVYLLILGINASKETNETLLLWVFGALLVVDIILPCGFFIVHPNESKVLILFGRYVGSVRESGFWYTNPFNMKKAISLRIRNFNSEKIKVNDLHGNPIEIAAVVVWRVTDTARAMFDVENYENFVAIQSETAIRNLATAYPYDSQEESESSLRGKPNEIAEALQAQLQARLEVAGVVVNEARISHLAYAQEIAQAMLRRQQAQAIIAARQKIVEGAVGMVELALKHLSEHQIVKLDEERKATMVNNLMVALVSESQVHPVINMGTLYQ